MRAVIDAVIERLWQGDETEIRIPDICQATGVNYGSVYHHFGSREGVIDAAYDQLFRDLVSQDLARIEAVSGRAQNAAEYFELVRPLVDVLSGGEERRRRRAMRVRIISASLTRPHLAELIGETQAEFMAELTDLVRLGQRNGFLRPDVDAGGLATVLQATLFGRVIDDVSADPVEQATWEATVGTLLMAVINPAPSA